jgi:hypothetical protein
MNSGNMHVDRLYIAVCDGAVNADREDQSCPDVNMKVI